MPTASTARRYGGTGLGLLISKQLVELMGGSIALVSPGEGLGATCTVELPLRVADGTDGQTATSGSPATATLAVSRTGGASNGSTSPRFFSRDPSPGSGGSPRPIRSPPDWSGKRVLVAEDNPTLARILRHQLRRFGLEADVVENGAEAVEAVRELVRATGRAYDVCLFDIQMPLVDGLEATRQIRLCLGADGFCPIVALTASAIRGDRERCLAAGMSDYLAKPVHPSQLERVLLHFFAEGERRQPVSAVWNGP